MPVTEIGDPRLQALFGANDPRDSGIRPAVRLPRRGLPPVALGAIAAVLGVLLFVVLNERRLSQSEPSVATAPQALGASAWQPPPPLYVPPDDAPSIAPATAPRIVERQQALPVVAPAPAPVSRPAPVQTVYVPQPVPQTAPAPPLQPRVSAGSALVIDTSGNRGGTATPGSFSSLVPRSDTGRMRASALANRSMTVTQGTLIEAVLETGFDSTQRGFARAVVSRDVRSFDGTNVLIPRGSKLIGEYRSDVGQGQKRAVIVWTRLIRPDGMTISMDSPAVDTLGRGGVAASVNTHFWARLGDALLQSTVGLGSALAQRSVAGPVLVLSGNAGANSTGALAPATNYVPTLTVPAGKSISVFVAHDLDFSRAGAQG